MVLAAGECIQSGIWLHSPLPPPSSSSSSSHWYSVSEGFSCKLWDELTDDRTIRLSGWLVLWSIRPRWQISWQRFTQEAPWHRSPGCFLSAPMKGKEQMSGLKPHNFSWAANFVLFEVSPEAYLNFSPCTKSYAYLYSHLEDSHYVKWRVSDMEEAIKEEQWAQWSVVIGDTSAEMSFILPMPE